MNHAVLLPVCIGALSTIKKSPCLSSPLIQQSKTNSAKVHRVFVASVKSYTIGHCSKCCHFAKAHGTTNTKGKFSHKHPVTPEGKFEPCTDLRSCPTHYADNEKHKKEVREEKEKVSKKATLMSEDLNKRISSAPISERKSVLKEELAKLQAARRSTSDTDDSDVVIVKSNTKARRSQEPKPAIPPTPQPTPVTHLACQQCCNQVQLQCQSSSGDMQATATGTR